MDASPVGQSPFSLLGFGYEPAGSTTAGVGDPLLAASLAQISTSMDVLAAFASPDPSPAVAPSFGSLLDPVAAAAGSPQDPSFGTAIQGFAASPDALLPVAALLFDGFA